MRYDWERYSRQGIDVASTLTALAFSAVRTTTKFGFSLVRNVASSTVGATANALDYTVFGNNVTAPVIEGAVASAINFAEALTLAPIFLGEYISAASLRVAHSSIDILSIIFSGSTEASFSLVSFIHLVKREWYNPAAPKGSIPRKNYGIREVGKAIVAWVALQGVTQEWHEKEWKNSLREIEVHDPHSGPQLKRVPSRVRVTSDVIFPGNRGQLISADIGEAPPGTQNTRKRSLSVLSRVSFSSMATVRRKDKEDLFERPQKSIDEIKSNLRRFSKMVLAGYGGASLLFFGVSPWLTSTSNRITPPTTRNQKEVEEAQLESAINAAEAEAEGDSSYPSSTPDNLEFSWWDILMGKHDKEIFERSVHGDTPNTRDVRARVRATAVIGIERQMPRFWVLTDHDRRQVVLVLRGTMSLNELAVDLTCVPVEFIPSWGVSGEDKYHHDTHSPSDNKVPAANAGRPQLPRRPSLRSYPSLDRRPRYHVHGGMLRMARVMGEIGKPVHRAVANALSRNPGYELILCGHSLGAGVATLLALMWADPTTCLTIPSSGLPADCPVFVYAFAPPCLTDATLSHLASNLVVSFVYSDDVVSRLSLGSVRDIRNAALLLCDANERGEEGYSVTTQRAREWKSGKGSDDDFRWFLAMRRTLEANMHMADLFPPGRVFWARRDGDLPPSQRLTTSTDKVRLFEVLDTENVFSQIVFSRSMLGAHMPHRYDQVLHELL
ncbi:hypothetical protein M404DRAFT_146492 [Pisolithus tinctorius Marx 270]|uniref:sn-1-specific diacylglycerol lipase n=1 Tax=Pisolithus tinctorius Marx 270 TaxID=870435 RepID=A0A0C3NQ93_PISTI|nr:hypothetical protein M404DRAFT_146492 [Pisolithus tinctorius Marx 270]